MEFKGTKLLQVDLKHNQVLNSSGVLVIANINDYSGEGKYNTLLYSKAPEMLEGLKEALRLAKECRNLTMVEYFEKLIKQATDILQDRCFA